MAFGKYEKKIARARMDLGSLRDDLGRVKTPSLRVFVCSQIAQKQFQIGYLMEKITNDAATKALSAQPLSEKKAPHPAVITVVKKKKALDEQNRIRVK